jgi:hypothetical protein
MSATATAPRPDTTIQENPRLELFFGLMSAVLFAFAVGLSSGIISEGKMVLGGVLLGITLLTGIVECVWVVCHYKKWLCYRPQPTTDSAVV